MNECGYEWDDEDGHHTCELDKDHPEFYHLGQGFISVPTMITPMKEE